MKATGTVDRPEGARRWRVRLRINGKQQTVAWYDTEEEARHRQASHIAALAETAADYEGLTVAALGHKVLTRREVKRQVRDPGSDWSRWNEHVRGARLGSMAVRAVRSSHVYAWLDGLEDKGLAAATRRNVLCLLRVVFRSAHRAGQVPANPCLGVRVEGKDKAAWTYLTPAELPRLLGAFEDFEQRTIAAIAIGTGLRPGELVSLRLADVHVDDRPRLIVRYGSAPDLPTKTGAVRTVHLFGLALEAMRAWLARPAPKRNPHGLCFPLPRGAFRDRGHVVPWESWKAVLARAGITRRFRWYDFRHTCASWLVSGWWGRRWSLEEVKEMLGHTSITITQRYAHLAESASEEAARATGIRASVSQPTAETGNDGEAGKATEPPWGIEPQTYGLRKPGFRPSKAGIWPSDSSLTRAPSWVREAALNLALLRYAARGL